MSRSNPPFYSGPDLALPDADDFLHNPSSAISSNQGAGEDPGLSNSESKGSFLLDWNLHYEDPGVQENLPDSALFSDLMVDFGSTGAGLSTSSFPSDTILELSNPGMEIFGNNEDLLSPKRNNSKSLPPFSGPTLPKPSKASNQTGAKKDAKSSGVLDCICNQPQGDRFILVCDKCDKWFHCECVGISQEQAEEMASERHIWLCPVCNESSGASNKNQPSRQPEPRSQMSTRSQNKAEVKIPMLKIPKKATPPKEAGKRCYLKSCQKRLANSTHHFCSNTCIEVTVNNLKSFYQIKGLSSADSERVTLLDKANMKVLTGMAAPTLGGLASWLKAHPTHVPIKPQPRPIQEAPTSASSKPESRAETFSSHEEIVRGKARKQLTEILLSRVETSPEYAKYKDSIPKLASQIETQLFNLDHSISTRYKNRYRNISFSLRESKNVGLYRRVVSGEVLPADLVQMTTGQLIPESSNNGKEAKNNSNTDNGSTRGKTHDKQTSVVNYSSGDMARKNANIQPKNQSSTQHVAEDHKSKQGSGHDTKQSKFQTNKPNDIPESSEVDIPQPKFSPTLSDSDEHAEWDKVVWKGCISMPNLAKCSTNGYLAYGHHLPDMEKILPENVQVHGRIVYPMVWDYLKKIVSSTTKGLVVLKLVPETGVEQLSFTTLFNYFYKRQRCGVAGGCTAAVRDLYLLPFAKGDTIPTVLTSLQGPGISSLKEDTLLAMIVTNKLSQTPQSALASKKIGSESDAVRAADTRNTQLKPELRTKDDSTSLTNPSAPLPFSNLQSKSELPFSSSAEHSAPATGSSDTFASPLFNPSGLYKPISENDGLDRKDSYMIPYDKVEKETPFNLSLGSKSASDHMFPALGEILKKTIDDPIIDDALSNFQFKKPIKEEVIPEQKLHGEYGYQFQDQFGYGNPSYPASEPRPGEAAYTDVHGARPPVQQQHRPHSNFPPDPNVDQFNTEPNQGYYGHDPQAPPHGHPAYPPHSQGGVGYTQGGPENREYWQQGTRDPPHQGTQPLEGFPPPPQNQPGHPESFERYPPHHWQGHPTQGVDSTQPNQERHHSFDPPQHFPHPQPHDVPHPSEYPHSTKPGYVPPGQFHQAAESRPPSQHHPLEHAESHNFERDRQEHPENNLHRMHSHQNEHENNYRDPRRDFPPCEDKYDSYPENERQQPYHPPEAKEKDREPYRPPHEHVEGRDWKPPYAREEDKWVGNDRRQRQDRGAVSDEVYRDFRFEREERERLETDRARSDYGRTPDTEFLDRARLEERVLPPFMRRRLPLRTSLSHHLDLARRDLAFPGRGKAFPLGLGAGPSLVDRERARMKREYPLDKDIMAGAPFKMYRSMESPPKPSFEPISRSRPTLRVRKRERERDRARKREGRGEDKSADLPKDESESQVSKRGEKKSSRRRSSRSSKNIEKPHETSEAKSDTVSATPEKTDIPDTTDTTEAVPDSNTAQEVYPQVVQVAQEGAGSKGLEKAHEPIPSEDKLSEDENGMKFPPKHLQREKLLAMKEKLQTERGPAPHSSRSRTSERGDRKRRSTSRSRDRESRSGRKRRSRSRDRRRAHSRDEIIREKEGASLREIGRDRMLREREDVPRRDSPPLFRERQLIALERERERELLRARARMSLPSPSTLEAIRDRSPLHMANFDPRRPIITPYMRARALDELRRERLDRGVVPPGLRGQYLYQDPRPL